MNLAEAKALGLPFPTRKRIGRGIGSGIGKTSGRGHKGAKSRSGWSRRIGWEGGQMPLYRRLPKVGFNNKIFKKVYTVINVGDLNVFADGTVVDLAAVLQKGLTSKEKQSNLFKVLGDGDLERRLVIKADSVTMSARAKIEQAGGKVDLIPAKSVREKFVRRDGTRSQPGGVARRSAARQPTAADPKK
jgi:large subunit ribosomal protein L15